MSEIETNPHRYGRRTTSAWYWRNRGDDRDEAWEFLGYGRPTAFYLQAEYLEIRT